MLLVVMVMEGTFLCYSLGSTYQGARIGVMELLRLGGLW